MWNDLSFDVRSFGPESWGPSWGLTWEAAQADLNPPQPGGHWKHLLRPAQDCVCEVVGANGHSRVAVIRPEVVVGSESAVLRPKRIILSSSVGRVDVSCGILVPARSVASNIGVETLRVKAGASIYLRGVSGSHEVRAKTNCSASSMSKSSFGLARVAYIQPKSVQNLPEEVLLVLL